ncbi:NAD(+) synthase [Candidatus Gracilibacteria bacterium]|nr:NAD(+) synthase [Candidatus Gracilibacteria bacterium]
MYKIAQMEVIPGRPDINQQNIIDQINLAKDEGRDLIVFPEMAVPGYMLGDKWENDRFVIDSYRKNEKIIEATRGKITAIWGNVLPEFSQNRKGEDGRLRKYNAAFVASNGALITNWGSGEAVIKTLMPKYREFDDERYFYSTLKLAQERGEDYRDYLEPYELIIDNVRRKVGVIICEDMWDEDYFAKPTEILKSKGAELIFNLSSSPFGNGKQGKRDRILEEKSKGIELIYANNVGIQNNGKNIFTFDGASVIYKNGKKIAQAKSFEETGITLKTGIENEKEEIEKIFESLVYAIKEYFKLIKKEKVVLGLSGGVDSAVVAALMTLALGKKNVITVNMPSRFNSETTKDLAKLQAERLGVKYFTFPIQESVDNTAGEFEKIFGKKIEGLVLENIQARDRGSRVLAGVSAIYNAVFTNNGNKSEIAQGYATLYGDVNGSICPIGDLYKTQVWELARFINTKHPNLILEEIINIIPSAELSENQDVDKGLGDPFNYEYLDKLLYQFVELRKDPVEILEYFRDGVLQEKLNLDNPVEKYFKNTLAFIADLEKVYKNLNLFFFKRIQAPPIISVSKRAFGYDLREAVLDDYILTQYTKLKEEILTNQK